MKLFMNKNEKYEEPEVHMFFHKQTKKVEQVEKFVRSLSITIPTKYEDEIYKLYPTDIYYIETIDRRTYLYTASRVYESSENLLSLEKLCFVCSTFIAKKHKTMKETLFHIRDTIRILPQNACFSMYFSILSCVNRNHDTNKRV